MCLLNFRCVPPYKSGMTFQILLAYTRATLQTDTMELRSKVPYDVTEYRALVNVTNLPFCSAPEENGAWDVQAKKRI